MSLKPTSFKTLAGRLLLASSLAILAIGCRDQINQGDSSATQPSVAATADESTASPVEAEVEQANTPPLPAEAAVSEFYAQGINRASSAYNFSQTARSPDEWRLVASRWQQAIDLLELVPEGDPNYATAQQKISEYQRNLTYAQGQADQIIAASQAPVAPIAPTPSSVQAAPQTAAAGTSIQSEQTVYQVPILRRLARTPVVPVNFNGQRYEMILDTGASGTLITAGMANSLNITPIGRTRVATASASSVSLSVGIVDVIQVGGIVETDVTVAIAGPELDVGLLGHDVFGNFDITIRQNMVEFRPR